MAAAMALAERTAVDVINTPTKGMARMPGGYTCLHFAADSSDRSFERIDLCKLLLAKRADLDARSDGGNTPYLLAAGSGVTDIVDLLLAAGTQKNALNDNGASATSKSKESSSSVYATLNNAHVRTPKAEAVSGRTRNPKTNEARDARLVRRDYANKPARR